MLIELIRQFYDMPRQFRIMGEQGQMQFTSMDNSMMQPQPMMVGDQLMGYRLPVYDIKVKVQKRNAYTRTAQNELALQLYGAGFFAPQQATPALQCLEMMDFEGKDELMQKISQNGTLFQMLQQTQAVALQLARLVDMKENTNLTEQLAAQFQGAGPVMMPAQGAAPAADLAQESGVTQKARAQAARTTEANR